MNPSTVARCAIANECLRRRKQPYYDATNRGHPEHHVKLLTVTFEGVPYDEPRTEQNLMVTSRPLTASTMREDRCTETNGMSMVTLDRTSAATMYPRKFSVRASTTKRKRTGSAVLVALQLKADRSAPTAPTVAESDGQGTYPKEQILDERKTVTQASQDMANQKYPVPTAFRFPSSEDNHTSTTSVPPPHPKVSSETASPTSDTTLVEDGPLCSVSPSGCGEDVRQNTDHDGILRMEMPAERARPVKEYEPTTPVAKKYIRHRRYVSSNSVPDVVQAPSASVQSRARTNDGLHLFRANSSKEPTANVHRGRHRHRISLNLPVNSHVDQHSGFQQSQQPNTEDWTQPLAGAELAHSATGLDIWHAEERDLEYKYRHTFIGTGSLEDFLEVLEISTTHTTTRNAVSRAFVQLASAEQLYARQSSTRNNGWDLIARTPLTVMDVTSVDYVVQLRVKLGSITLRQLLDLILFDEAEQATAIRVVEAFSIASHMDMTAGIGTGSKAKAFRSWLVEQMKADAST